MNTDLPYIGVSPRRRPSRTEAEIQAALDQARIDRRLKMLKELPGTVARCALLVLLAPFWFVAAVIATVTSPIWLPPYLFVVCPEFRRGVVGLLGQIVGFMVVVGGIFGFGRLCGWW